MAKYNFYGKETREPEKIYEINNVPTVNVGDYVYGHFVHLNDNNEYENIDFNFRLLDRKSLSNTFDSLEKFFDIKDHPIVYTDSPLGKSILGKPINLTFIVDDAKFYIDHITNPEEKKTSSSKK